MTTGRLVNLFASVGITLCAHYVVADGMVGRVESEALYNPGYIDRSGYEFLNR